MISVERNFDEFLGGGLLDGVLTQIYGPPGSGKTNIALMAVANASVQGKVLYVDSEGGFSVERLRQITRGKLEKVMENVILTKPTTFSEQQSSVRKIEGVVKDNQVVFVVFDSIGNLFRLEEGRDVRAFGRELAQLLRISRKYEIPILLTNQVFTDIESGAIVPVGGKVNEYWSKIMLELGRENSRRFALIKKHLFKPEGLKLEFQIVNEGLQILGELPSNFAIHHTPR